MVDSIGVEFLAGLVYDLAAMRDYQNTLAGLDRIADDTGRGNSLAAAGGRDQEDAPHAGK